MNPKRTSLEVIAPTVEEALTKGLGELGLSEQDVEVEVLDEGSRGLFGLGSRQARIRMTIKTQAIEPIDQIATQSFSVATKGYSQPVSSVQPYRDEPPSPEAARSDAPVEEDMALRIARETVEDLLDNMKVKCRVSVRYGTPDEMQSKPPVLVDVHGNDLSFLIGRHAETLNALQYIASLIVGKELGHSIPLVIDVEGYRARREQQIRQLARRMADQAIKTGKRQVLEPMPANERRLIHIELRDHPQVTTESIGEDPRRKVTIIPK